MFVYPVFQITSHHSQEAEVTKPSPDSRADMQNVGRQPGAHDSALKGKSSHMLQQVLTEG